MLYAARERIKKWWFRARCRDIFSTKPIQPGGNEITIVSMVSHPDLAMYLLAVKSLYVQLGAGCIFVVNDGTLSPRDIKLLKANLSPCEIMAISDIEVGRCPKGGMWERLLLIAECVQRSYVIQLDSDTLTLSHIPEISSAIKENRSFTLGTGMGRQISAMRDVCEQMKAYESQHIQVIAEQNFDKCLNYDQLKYVRGCAAFAGFAKGSFSRSKVEEFSQSMESILGKMWASWGSEQVTSNFIVANSPQSCVLPYPKYANFTLEIPYDQSSFLHFIGTYRFKKGVYMRKAKEILRNLKSYR